MSTVFIMFVMTPILALISTLDFFSSRDILVDRRQKYISVVVVFFFHLQPWLPKYLLHTTGNFSSGCWRWFSFFFNKIFAPYYWVYHPYLSDFLFSISVLEDPFSSIIHSKFLKACTFLILLVSMEISSSKGVIICSIFS